MFPRADAIKMVPGHQSHQLDPCGACRLDYKDVRLDITVLHSSCLFNQKRIYVHGNISREYFWDEF